MQQHKISRFPRTLSRIDMYEAEVRETKMAEFRVDPLIYNEAIILPEWAETKISDVLTSITGYPLGTRPISKGSKPVKV